MKTTAVSDPRRQTQVLIRVGRCHRRRRCTSAFGGATDEDLWLATYLLRLRPRTVLPVQDFSLRLAPAPPARNPMSNGSSVPRLSVDATSGSVNRVCPHRLSPPSLWIPLRKVANYFASGC